MTEGTIWSGEVRQHPSCRVNNPSMRTNVIRTNPTEMDPTSLYVNGEMSGLGSGCWYRDTAQTRNPCAFKIDRKSPDSMKDLSVDLNILNCGNTWVAPLWIDPVPYGGSKYSGEIDLFEVCGNRPMQNYAGWGVQLPWNGVDINNGSGPYRFHIHYDQGQDKLTTWACPLNMMGIGGTEDTSKCIGGGNFENFSQTVGNDSKMYHLVSSLWNPSPNLNQGGQTCGNNISPGSRCSFDMQNIKISSQGGQPIFSKDSVCSFLNVYS